MSIPGVAVSTALRALFSEYMEKGRAVLDSFWIASWGAERAFFVSVSKFLLDP